VTVAAWDADAADSELDADADADAAAAAAGEPAPPPPRPVMAPYVALALRAHGAGGAAETVQLKLSLPEFKARCAHRRGARACAAGADAVAPRAPQELAKAVRDMQRAMNAL
jgi:hypothetical protein